MVPVNSHVTMLHTKQGQSKNYTEDGHPLTLALKSGGDEGLKVNFITIRCKGNVL